MQRWVLVVLWHLWVMRAPHDLARKSMNPPRMPTMMLCLKQLTVRQHQLKFMGNPLQSRSHLTYMCMQHVNNDSYLGDQSRESSTCMNDAIYLHICRMVMSLRDRWLLLLVQTLSILRLRKLMVLLSWMVPLDLQRPDRRLPHVGKFAQHCHASQPQRRSHCPLLMRMFAGEIGWGCKGTGASYVYCEEKEGGDELTPLGPRRVSQQTKVGDSTAVDVVQLRQGQVRVVQAVYNAM